MRITSEMQLLDQETRKNLIEKVFNAPAAKCRKDEAFKGYECLKDETVHYVVDLLKDQYDWETVFEMQYALTNISIFRKVIDKLAKVYANGVKRSMPEKEAAKKDPEGEDAAPTKDGEVDAGTQAIEKAAEFLGLNAVMTKCNRYFRAFKNSLVYVKPIKLEDEGGKYTLKVEALPPFHYDAVENANDPEKAIAIVLSDYTPSRGGLYVLGDPALAQRVRNSKIRVKGEEENRLIASYTPTGIGPDPQSTGAPGSDAKQYIWWTKSFHFTTNARGEIIPQGPDDDGKNPILELPFVDVSAEKDGEFFAKGGRDLIDAGVQINVGLTNIKHIGVTQGFGQMYMTGKNLPKSVKVGPNHCIQLEQNDKEDPTPEIGVLTSQPPLTDLKGVLEMEVALMLTTNNLSVSSVASNLQGGKDFASGIALVIDRAESIEDVSEQAKVFVAKEPKVWGLVGKWADYLKTYFTEDAKLALALPKNPETVQVDFPPAEPVMSEMDRLEIIEKRKDLGLNTEAELLMRDQPGLTETEAEAKLAKIAEEKQKRMADAVSTMGGENGNQGQEDDGNGGGNFGNDRANQGAQAKPGGQGPNQE